MRCGIVILSPPTLLELDLARRPQGVRAFFISAAKTGNTHEDISNFYRRNLAPP